MATRLKGIIPKIKKLNVFCLTRLPFLYYIKYKKVLKNITFCNLYLLFIKFCVFLQRQNKISNP